MSKPKRSFDHEKALKKLRAFGFKGSTRTKAGKAKVKQLWKDYGGYINHTEKPRTIRSGFVGRPVTQKEIKSGKVKLPQKQYNFKHQKLTPAQLKKAKASKLFSKQQFTPNGLFIEKPVNISGRNFKVTFKGGNVEIKGGARKEIITRLDTKELISNPKQAVKNAIERGKRKLKPKTYSLTVNGFRSKHISSSLRSLQYYLNNVLLPEWLDKNPDLDEKDFTDIFHIRMLY